MAPTPEVSAFLKSLADLPPGPGISLDSILQPAIDAEANLRRLFALEKTSPTIRDPYVGLIDVFSVPKSIQQTRARRVEDEEDLTARYVLPLSAEARRGDGEMAMSSSIEEFKENFRIFSEGSLSQLDWNNVIVAGGSVLACLSPIPESARTSKRSLRKWFHTDAYPTSDVDMFIWGLAPEAAEQKIKTIYESIRDSVPWDVTCVRTKHTVSIHSQYPYRTIQIVLRLYSSPAEILAGFDVDVACCAYDGSRVWVNPRAMMALIRQCNTVDMTRRSPSYEVRLAKYAARIFEVYVPNLRRKDVDPTIFERSIVRVEGLARLLVLEKLANPESRVAYLDSRRKSRGRPNAQRSWRRQGKKYKGDLKSDMANNGLEVNDYDVSSLHIPYGPGWDAKRIEKLIYQTDLGMNSPFNPKNKGRKLHRHPAFFGDLDCLEDCCQACPKPDGNEEAKQQEIEDKSYLRGRIAFIEENPGRQSISGSFNPIDEGEWSEQAYMTENMKLFSAIASSNRSAVLRLLEDKIDLNRRDHVGRSPLHAAILFKAEDIAIDLIEAGARVTARLVDGRTSLHLAAQLGQVKVVRKLFERSALNSITADNTNDDEDALVSNSERPSSMDDWSSDSDDGKQEAVKETAPVTIEAPEGLPEDATGDPDILNVNVADWDLAFTPLDYAVVAGSAEVVSELLANGADLSAHTKAQGHYAQPINPLTLVTLSARPEETSEIIATLVKAGAKSSTAESNFLSIFHRIVRIPGSAKLVSMLLQHDETAKLALNHPYFSQNAAVYPIVSALYFSDWATFSVLIAHGAKIVLTEEAVFTAQDAYKLTLNQANGSRHFFGDSDGSFPGNVYMPFEVALSRSDDIVHLLVQLGAEINSGPRQAFANSWSTNLNMSWLDLARVARERVAPHPEESSEDVSGVPESIKNPEVACHDSWKSYFESVRSTFAKIDAKRSNNQVLWLSVSDQKEEELRSYIEDVEGLLVTSGAKTWNDIYPHKPAPTDVGSSHLRYRTQRTRRAHNEKTPGYVRRTHGKLDEPVPAYLTSAYDALFEACWAGNNEEIRRLCLPTNNQGVDEPKPLIIAVQAVEDIRHGYGGFNPIHVAVLRRHWNTIRLILSISAAQYQPEEDKETIKFESVKKMMQEDLNEDSDRDSDYDSDASEKTEGAAYLDLANLKSSVHSTMSPLELLQSYAKLPNGDYTDTKTSISLGQIIDDGDFDGFKKMLTLSVDISSDKHIPSNNNQSLSFILRSDNPEMLDYYIRHTGAGIILDDVSETISPSTVEKEEESSSAKIDDERNYDGLIVRGIKRKDLARRGDPNAKPVQKPYTPLPLVWQASMECAVKILEYLNGPRPLEAYKVYATKFDNGRAMRLRAYANLEDDLPTLLGWAPNSHNESVFLAAATAYVTNLLPGGSSRSPENTIKRLFEIRPQLGEKLINLPLRRVGLTPLLVTVSRRPVLATVETLLDLGADPIASDWNGWNVYHHAVAYADEKMIQFLSEKLPKEVSEELLRQRTKKRLNTPLQLAVKRGYPTVVQAVLESVKQPLAFDLFDANGDTPLHTAILGGKAQITRILLDSMSSLNCNLSSENAVGNTPLEMATQRYVQFKTQSPNEFGGDIAMTTIPPYDIGQLPRPVRSDAENLDRKLSALRETLAMLEQEGRLTPGSPTGTAFANFVKRMDKHLIAARSVATKKEEDIASQKVVDPCNIIETFKLVQDAVTRHPSPRRLVHLYEVQNVVERILKEQKEAESIVQMHHLRSRFRRRGDPDIDFDEKDKEEELWGGVLFLDGTGGWRGSYRYNYRDGNDIRSIFGEDTD